MNCPEILKEFEEQSKKEKPEKKKQTKRKLDDDLVIKGSVEESSSAAVKSPRGASPRNQEIDRILQSKSTSSDSLICLIDLSFYLLINTKANVGVCSGSASPAPHLPPPAKRGFLFGDEPAGILGAMAPTSKTEAAYQVQWKDKNGKKSRDCTWVQSSQLRKYAPLFLIEYLEKNMKQKVSCAAYCILWVSLLLTSSSESDQMKKGSSTR